MSFITYGSSPGKSAVQRVGFGKCTQVQCSSKRAPPKEVKYLGDEFFDGEHYGLLSTGNPLLVAPEFSRASRPWGTSGTSSVAAAGIGRVDFKVKHTVPPTYLYNYPYR
jgi:hypothetical protein